MFILSAAVRPAETIFCPGRVFLNLGASSLTKPKLLTPLKSSNGARWLRAAKSRTSLIMIFVNAISSPVVDLRISIGVMFAPVGDDTTSFTID